jgi:heptosyltransferase II
LPGVSLSVYAALLGRAALVVANDTGPAHMAAAVGAPLISVFGPTPVAHWRPWGTQVQVISRWPAWPSVDEVWSAAALSLGRMA